MKNLLLFVCLLFTVNITYSQTTIKSSSIEYKFDYSNFYTVKTSTVTVTKLPTVEIFNSNQIYHNTPVNISLTPDIMILNPNPINSPVNVNLFGIINNSYVNNVKPPSYNYIEKIINKPVKINYE